MIYERAVDRERILARKRNYKKDTFLAGKRRRLYKTLICPDTIGIALQTAPLNVYLHTPRGSVFAHLASEHPVSSAGQAFE